MLISNKGQARFVERILIVFLTLVFVFALYGIIKNSANEFARGYFLLKSRQYLNLFDFYISLLKKENVISGEICLLKDKDIEILFHNNTVVFKKNGYMYIYNWEYNLTGICSKNKRICIRKKDNVIEIYCKSLSEKLDKYFYLNYGYNCSNVDGITCSEILNYTELVYGDIEGCKIIWNNGTESIISVGTSIKDNTGKEFYCNCIAENCYWK